MDDKAIDIVYDYIIEHLDKSDDVSDFEVYVVWKCKALQNWKYLLSSTLLDGMYYELTFNGDKKEWYLDAYKKFENRTVRSIESIKSGNFTIPDGKPLGQKSQERTNCIYGDCDAYYKACGLWEDYGETSGLLEE